MGMFSITTAAAATALALCAPAQTLKAGGIVVHSCPAAEPWMIKVQAEDGSYAGADGRPSVAATSLCMLAMLGDGSTLRGGPHKGALKKAFRWLRAQQDRDGRYVGAAAASTRDHALATYAMVEALGLSKWKLHRVAVEDALTALSRMRHPDGGWTANPATPFSDARTTGWSAMAALSAEHFGFRSAPSKGLLQWFDELRAETVTDEAVRLSCALYAGRDPREHPEMSRAADRIVAQAKLADPEQTYWASYALYQLGGKRWSRWQDKVKAKILASQITDHDDEHATSWAPIAPFGRARTTALQVLTLEAYFRYSRLVR